MQEITGNLWDYYGRRNEVVCITTNGAVKLDGNAVMGRGCALQATQKIPGIALKLGASIKKNGNVACWLEEDVLISFPVKHKWFEKADIKLIRQSADWLHEQAMLLPFTTFILPRPGCGNGKLSYSQVQPILVKLPHNVHVIDFVNPTAGDSLVKKSLRILKDDQLTIWD